MPSSHPPPILSIHVYTDPEDQMKRSFILDIVYALRDDLFIHGKKSLKWDRPASEGSIESIITIWTENRSWSAHYENPFNGSLHKSKKLMAVTEALKQFSYFS